MNSPYWFLAVLIVIATFQTYLFLTSQRVTFRARNLSEKKPPAPIWRHGRCWWSIETVNQEHWQQGPGARLEWSIGRHETFAVDITVLDEEGDDIQLHLAIPFLISLFFTLERLPLFNRIPYTWRRNFGYETSVKFFSGSLWIHVLHSEMWGTRHGQFRWLPRWISISTSAGYKEYRGVGFYVCFNFDRLIFGSYERTEENIGEPIVMEIPIEPDNRLGLRYWATFQRQIETRWRGNFPWRKRRAEYWDVSTDHPPMHAGKGENSWDLDDDGITGCAVTAETVAEAVQKYVEKCQADRKRYGLPNAIYKLQRGTIQ